MALTLRLLGGLTTEEIARAFLVPEATVAQRIVRAKRTLAEARVPFEVPRGAELRGPLRRCSRSSTSSSTRATRRPPATTGCGPACARTRCASAASWPSSRRDEPEVHGLVALMEIQASRSARGRPVGRAGPAARSEPGALGSAAHPPRPRGARARRSTRRRARPVRAAGRDRRLSRAGAHAAETDWARIAALYDALATTRAVARRGAEPRGRGRRWRSARRGPRARRSR